MRKILSFAVIIVMLLCSFPAMAEKADLSGKHYYDVHKTLLYEKSKASEAGVQSEISLHKDLVYAFPHCRALVGRNCVANDIFNTVGVASWPKDLGNMTNNDLSDYTSFQNVVNADAGYSPITSVRDMTHHYAAGTVAGFCIAQEGGKGVLSLDLIKKFTLEFYCEGKLVGSSVAASGSSFNGLSLSVGAIPGSKNATCNIQAVAPDEFDEVRLVNAGVSVNLIGAIDVHYAYVGEVAAYTLTNKDKTVPSSMKDFDDYCSDYGLTKEKDVDGPTVLVNANITDKVVAEAIITLGTSIPRKVETSVKEGESFKAGTVVGFKGIAGSALNLSLLGGGIYIKTYDKQGVVMDRYQMDQSILSLNLIKGGTVNFSFITTKPFSSVSIQFTGVKVNLGGTVLNYAFVAPAPDIEHHCAIDPTPDMNICEDQTSLQLYHNNAIHVTWTCKEGGATIDHNGHVTGMTGNAGTKYVFRATADDGCYDDVTVVKNQGQSSNPVQCENMISKDNGFEMSENMPGVTAALISASKFDDGSDNLLDGQKDTYAKYIAGLQVAGHVGVVAIQTKDKAKTFRQTFDIDADKKVKVGFVVQSKGTGLNVNLLNGYSMGFFKNGQNVYTSALNQANVLNLAVAGSDKLQKMEFAAVVPENVDFDQMALYHDGVLGVNASEQDFYYPFYESGDDIEKCDDPLGCDPTIISAAIPSSLTDQSHSSGASIDGNLTGNFSTVTVAGGIGNLSYLIDGDLSTGVTIGNVAQIGGGTKIAVKLGRRADYRQQLAIVMDNNNYESIFGGKSAEGKGFDPIGVGLGKWMKVETYLDGVATGDTKTDWSVIGADVIATKNNNVYVWNPKKEYDEVVITIAGVLKAADVQKIYGILLQSDIDGDGVPDCKDDDSCNGDITDTNNPHACNGTDITFSFKGKTGLNYFVEAYDQSAERLSPTKTTDNGNGTSNYDFTVKTTKAGMYTARVMQESTSNSGYTQDGTIDYVVHPTITHWSPTTKSTDWNTWDNWVEGSPYHCTDVVIPTNAKVYPVLQNKNNDDDNSCNGIHFEPGAAVENVFRLNYNKAWVDLMLTNGIATLWAAPLAQVFSGDFFASEVKPENYFKDLDNTLDPDDFGVRTNPLVYQRIWKTSVKGNFTEGNQSLGDVTLISKSTWSHAFNALAQDYATKSDNKAPMCFSLMADDNSSSVDKYIIHLPKAGNRTYYYYNMFGESEGNAEVKHDETTTGKLWSTQYWTNVDNDLTLNYTNDTKASSDGIFLVANPTMSHLNISKFLEKNTGLSGVKLYNQGAAFSVIDVDGDLVSSSSTLTDADKFVAPSAAFFVEAAANNASNTLQVEYDNTMFGDQPGQTATTSPAATRAKASVNGGASEKGLIRITASDGSNASGAVLLKGCNAKAATLMDEDYKPAIAVFTIDGGRGYDIRPMDSDVVEIGLCVNKADSVRLSFHAEGNADGSQWMLYDRLTGMKYAEGDEPVVYLEGSSVGRFYLSRVGQTTGVRNVSGADGVYVTTAGDKAMVTSPRKDITAVEVYTANGTLLDKVSMDGAERATVNVCPGVILIKVTRKGSKTALFKYIVQ